jgi:uncharacterized protein YecT (DUF1311 family)
MSRFLFALPLLLAVASPASALDAAQCNSLASNAEMTNCVWEEYKKADAHLNAVWKQVMAAIPTRSGDLPADAAEAWNDDLLAAQRAWITFKEKDCAAVAYEWYGGSGANLAVGDCLYGHTAARTRDLEERYLSR